MKARDILAARELAERRAKLIKELNAIMNVIDERGMFWNSDSDGPIDLPRHTKSKTEARDAIHRFYDSLLAELDDLLREIGVDPVWEHETGAGFV